MTSNKLSRISTTTFNKIQEYWNTHTVADAIAELPKDDLQLLENVESSDSLYEDAFLRAIDCRCFNVLIRENTLRFRMMPTMPNQPSMFPGYDIGKIGITESQLKLISSVPREKQVEYVVKYAKAQQIQHVKRIQQITETVTDVNELTKQQAEELVIYERLEFITDDDVKSLWNVDCHYIWGISVSE